MVKTSVVLTNITVISQKLLASIPRRNFNKFTYMTWYCALEKGNVIEKYFMSIDFNIIRLMYDCTNMNVSTNYCTSMIWCLTSIHLIMNVWTIKLRCEWWKVKCSICINLSVEKKKRNRKGKMEIRLISKWNVSNR